MPLIVVGTVVVKGTLPEVVVIVWNEEVGTLTTATLVGVPLIVVGTVVVNAVLPEEAVIVESDGVG